jgi:hypothetical protein
MERDRITYFAETDARNKRVKFGVKSEDRLRHIYSIGKTGMGKSTLLENMAIQDIENGEGMAFLDPHGKTADLLLDYIPEHRIKDVIYFAPFDIEYPISFNVMEDVGPDRRHLVVSGLMSAFEKIWADAWSARMAYILQNTLAALLEYPGATLLGVNRMLSDKIYRAKVVDNIKDPTVKAFWTEEFAKYTERFASEATPAIQNKVGQFASNPLVRNIIGQSTSSFDIRKIMDERKILIVNLSKGLMGEGNANLLGSMLVTKIYLAAMSRADASSSELAKLPNFYLYVDEFQSFANKSFADILSEARKYKLSLNITHQYIEQMAEEVRAAVFGNVGTMVSFRVGSFDAEVLEKEFAPVFTMEDLVSLGRYQIYLKLMIDGVASAPFSATGLSPIPKPEISFRTDVMEMSRKNYAHPKGEVEKAIRAWHEDGQPKNNPPAPRSAPVQGRAQEREPEREARPRPLPAREGERREEPRPVKKETTEENNSLAQALEKAMKEKEVVTQHTKEERKVITEVKTMHSQPTRAEPVPLQTLRHGDKNQKKGPSPENMGALREALKKMEDEKLKNKKETPPPPPSKPNSEQVKKQNEVPKEVLEKVLTLE